MTFVATRSTTTGLLVAMMNPRSTGIPLVGRARFTVRAVWSKQLRDYIYAT